MFCNLEFPSTHRPLHELSTPVVVLRCQRKAHRFHRAARISRSSSNIVNSSITEAPSEVNENGTLPLTYKRLVAKRCGASFRKVANVQEVELRPPGPGQALIRITHAGINGGCETFRVRGEHVFAPNRQLQDFPLGAEGAGVVVALGPGAGGAGGRGGGTGGLQVGQLVAVNGAAAFSQYVTARSSLVVPVPDGVSGAEAAALVLSGVTACVALEATARVQAGEVVVVTAAAGGTGHLALQLAAAAGAVVVAVGGGPAKAAVAAALGAAHVVDHTQQDVAEALRRLFPGGVDVVYEGVGGRLREQLLGCLAPGGRLLQVGYISEYPHTREYAWQQHRQPEPHDSCQDAIRGSGSTSGGRDGAALVEGVTSGESALACTAMPVEAAGTSTSAAGAAGAGACGVMAPPSEQLFWGGLDVELEGRRVIGQIWPKDAKSILRCRRRVFQLAAGGRLRVLTDQGHGQRGVEGVVDAVEYMLRGGHVGKVVIEM